MTEVLKNVWPEWQIEQRLGEGSYGTVYKAVRKDYNVESCAAIKVISIPSHISEIDLLRSEGLDMDASKTYLEEVVNDFVNEIRIMQSLKGAHNIVSIEDYKVIEKTEEIGWDIYIRMELLTPFNNYICDKKLTEEQVVKLGYDICTALEICGKRNIIHRDIKPENIFVNDFGDFKLGDFGIARKLENATGGLSQRGAYNYMAPEVIKGNDYDARVDIYSLGIVLYRLSNDNRIPFLDTEKQLFSPVERRNAVERRIRGEALPPPCNASPDMANLILCACAFDPNQRFASASVMKQALKSISDRTYQTVDIYSDLDKTISVRPPRDDPKKGEKPKSVDTFGKKGKLPFIAAATVIVIFLAIAGIFVMPMLINKSSDDDSNNDDDSIMTDNSNETNSEQDHTDSITSNEEINPPVPTSISIAGEMYDTDMTGTLNLTGKNLYDEDIEDLIYMTNITEVILNDNHLICPSSLGELTNLERVIIRNNNINDISFVKELNNLLCIDVSGNAVTDISPLSNLKQLNEVWVYNNAISDISALAGFEHLKYGSFSDNMISDFTPLVGNEFYDLYIQSNDINGNFEAIRGLTVTHIFYVGGNGFDNLDDVYNYFYTDEDGAVVQY